MIITEQKCHVTYSSVTSVCISKNVPTDLNTSIHVTGDFFFPSGKEGGRGCDLNDKWIGDLDKV